ncbi:MAG: UbiA prenyltransferase family protein [Candidatus Aenigmarchaeota archaeon]|nr:UbiA prenyltransferase family protein [Candidatus Aenigmarchaeota archaeon]
MNNKKNNVIKTISAILLLSRIDISALGGSLFFLGEWFSDKVPPLSVSLPGLFSLVFILSGGSILNMVYDKNLDVYAGKAGALNFLYVSSKKLKLLSFFVFVVALFMLWCIGWQPLITGILLVITCITYSVPPFRFKTLPILDCMCNGIGGGMLPFLLGWATSARIELSSYIYSVIFGLLILSYYVISELFDIETDRKYGLKKTSVKLGVKGSIALAITIYFLSLFLVCLFFGFRFFWLISFAIFGCPIFCSIIFYNSLPFLRRLLGAVFIYLTIFLPTYLFITKPNLPIIIVPPIILSYIFFVHSLKSNFYLP